MAGIFKSGVQPVYPQCTCRATTIQHTECSTLYGSEPARPRCLGHTPLLSTASELDHGVTFFTIAFALEVHGDISIGTDVHGIRSPEIGRPGCRRSRSELVSCVWV